MREVVLDTETTGLDTRADRVVEIGCVELVDGLPTRREFHCYINPEQSMHWQALKVHGLSDEFLRDKPIFKDIVGEFLAFIGKDPIIAHNAAFDIGMLNEELHRIRKHRLKNTVVDTLAMARKKFPGKQLNLSALAKRFGLDVSGRDVHGALKDAKLLAEVYLGLNGGRQVSLDVSSEQTVDVLDGITPAEWTPMLVQPTADEAEAHAAFAATIRGAARKVIDRDERFGWLDECRVCGVIVRSSDVCDVHSGG